eukprot:11407488-Prorocentrum_lima.AAC.1
MMLRPEFPNDTLCIVLESTFRFYTISDYPAWYNPGAVSCDKSEQQRPVGCTVTCMHQKEEAK